MKNKNKNIDKFFSGKLPDPEIPADDAWGKMNDMLDAEMPDNQDSSWVKYRKGHVFKLLSGLFFVGITAIAVLWVVNNNAGKKSEMEKVAVSGLQSDSKGKIEERLNGPQNANAVEEEVNVGDEVNGGEEDVNVTDKENANVTNEKPETVIADHAKKEPESAQSKHIENASKPRPGLDNADGNKSDARYQKENYDLRSTSGEQLTRNVKGSQAGSKANQTYEVKSESFGKSLMSAKQNQFNGNPAMDAYKRLGQISLVQIKSLPFNVAAYNPDFAAKVKAGVRNTSLIPRTIPKTQQERSVAVGLEWNLTSPLRQSDFLFTGIDSTSKPALLLIPSIFVTKSFREKHALTLTLSANQPYFGNQASLAQVSDSLPGPDSSLYYVTTRLIKTAGVNVALQYQYAISSHFSIGAGLGYSHTLGGLVQEQANVRNREPLYSRLISLKGSAQVGQYLNRDILQVRAGVAYKVGRFQAGINILAPLSNVSASPDFPIRAINGQFFLRFRVWK